MAMVPANAASGALATLSRDGAAVPVTRRTIKGIEYAMFDAAAGSYVATYATGAAGGAGAGGGPAPARSAAADLTAPKVTLKPRSVRASARGTVTLRLTCPASETRCTIKVRLVDGRTTIASKTVKVTGGKTAKVTLRLTRAARRRLAARRRMRVKAVITATDAAGNRSSTTLRITLRAPPVPAP
jgi:hypothetical protein